MEQLEHSEVWQSPLDQTARKPVAWRYMLGDGKWRYQRDWCNGPALHPGHELTTDPVEALDGSSG